VGLGSKTSNGPYHVAGRLRLGEQHIGDQKIRSGQPKTGAERDGGLTSPS
jgi:hypothetical protein